MAINTEAVAAALASPRHSTETVHPVVERFFSAPAYGESYEDFQALESFREALLELPAEEQRGRALAFASAWDGGGDEEARSRFARAGFVQGIDYHQLAEGEAPELWGPGLAPISSYDVNDIMAALTQIGGAGEQLAACLDFAAFGERDERVFEWFREVFERKEPQVWISMSFTSPPEVDDRLLELMLAPLGEAPSVERFVEQVIPMQTTGAQDPEKLGVCSRWLEARGHRPIAPAIELRQKDLWDGGHAGGSNAVQGFLARVWSADAGLAEEAAEKLFSRMWSPPAVAAICASLPFDEKVEVEESDRYERLYRKGRLVVTHKGKPGKRGRIGLKLHGDEAKAKKDAAKKAAAMGKVR